MFSNAYSFKSYKIWLINNCIPLQQLSIWLKAQNIHYLSFMFFKFTYFHFIWGKGGYWREVSSLSEFIFQKSSTSKVEEGWTLEPGPRSRSRGGDANYLSHHLMFAKLYDNRKLQSNIKYSMNAGMSSEVSADILCDILKNIPNSYHLLYIFRNTTY